MMETFNRLVIQLFSGENDRPALVAFLAWVQDEGGMPALMTRIQVRGAGELYPGQTLTPAHISRLFSDAEQVCLARRMGLHPHEVAGWMTAYLPLVVQYLAPAGASLTGNNMLSQALSLLRERFLSS